MKYIDHQPCGGPDVLKVSEMPTPEPGPSEVLIEVHAAGVNRPDIAQRLGNYPPPPGASPVLGLEVAGRITKLGSEVTRWKVGDLVCALTPGGGYAEYCVAPADHCLPVPKGFTLVEAASLPETYFTVWTNVFDRAKLQPGEHFLVHGGSSGIGSTAIQLAKQWGATVYTTVGNDEKAQFCRDLGADVVYNYKEVDWAAELWEQTQKRGVDVILDMVGGDYVMKNLRSLAIEGRLVSIAFLQGRKVPDFDIGPLMTRRLTYTGSTLRPRSDEDKAKIADALITHVWPMFEAGKLKSCVYKTFPFDQVRAAHELMESSQHLGKIVLEIKPA